MTWWLDSDDGYYPDVVNCDVCRVHGPGRVNIPRNDFTGLAEGWTVAHAGTRFAMPRCPKHPDGFSRQTYCGPVNVDGDGRDVA